MIYKTVLTDKGTTTIPKDIRDKLGLKTGMLVSFVKNDATGEYVIQRTDTIDEIRQANKSAMRKANTTDKEYISGSGLSSHITDKLGN